MTPMVPEEAPGMPEHLVTALFDGAAEARGAADRLVGMGLDRATVRLIPRDAAAPDAAAPPVDEAGGGAWDALAALRLPDADRHGYAEALRRGGVLLAAWVGAHPSGDFARALEDAGAVDLDEREGEWWSGGWRGYRPGGGTRGPASGAAATAPPRTVARERLPGDGRVRRYQAAAPR
jgi:hypothetical protein